MSRKSAISPSIGLALCAALLLAGCSGPDRASGASQPAAAKPDPFLVRPGEGPGAGGGGGY
jgi:hypothetical protein